MGSRIRSVVRRSRWGEAIPDSSMGGEEEHVSGDVPPSTDAHSHVESYTRILV